jgi:hypothetical protein
VRTHHGRCPPRGEQWTVGWTWRPRPGIRNQVKSLLAVHAPKPRGHEVKCPPPCPRIVPSGVPRAFLSVSLRAMMGKGTQGYNRAGIYVQYQGKPKESETRTRPALPSARRAAVTDCSSPARSARHIEQFSQEQKFPGGRHRVAWLLQYSGATATGPTQDSEAGIWRAALLSSGRSTTWLAYPVEANCASGITNQYVGYWIQARNATWACRKEAM